MVVDDQQAESGDVDALCSDREFWKGCGVVWGMEQEGRWQTSTLVEKFYRPRPPSQKPTRDKRREGTSPNAVRDPLVALGDKAPKGSEQRLGQGEGC